MSSALKLFAIVVLIGLVQVNGEYFWRPWAPGSPPSDAIIGKDFRGLSYIVQAHIKNYGLYVGQAFASQNHVNVSMNINRTVTLTGTSSTLKVLCATNRDKILWYPVYSSTFANEVLNGLIKPVIGGVNVRGTNVYVGKYLDTATQRKSYYGSIEEDNLVRYHTGTNPVCQYYYEVLIVNENCASKCQD